MDATLTTYFFITLGILGVLIVMTYTNKSYPIEKKVETLKNLTEEKQLKE